MDNVLQILIEADATGLTTQLTRAQDTIVGFVDKMNSQQVDWTSILSSTISPAIITGIASLFASAITQTLSYNQAVTQQGEAVGLTSQQMAQFGSASQGIADTTGQSATDINAAMTALLPVMGYSIPDAMATATTIAQLAASGFGSISDITQAAIPILQAWGAQTSTQANVVLNSIMEAAQSSGQSFSTIADGINGFQANLIRSGATLQNFQDIAVTFGVTVANVGLKPATDMMTLFGQAATGANPGLNNFAGSAAMLKADLSDGKVSNALESMSLSLSKISPIVQSSLGIPDDVISGMKDYINDWSTIQKEIAATKEANATAATAFVATDTPVRQLQEDWQKILQALTDPAILTSIDAISNVLTGLVVMFTDILKLSQDLGTGINQAMETIANGALKTVLAGLGTFKEVLTTIEQLASSKGLSDVLNALGGTQQFETTPATNGSLSTSYSRDPSLTNINPPSSTSAPYFNSPTTSSNSNVTFNNTFNVTSPAGGASSTANSISTTLYNEMMGLTSSK
jgi:hypothetical protein